MKLHIILILAVVLCHVSFGQRSDGYTELVERSQPSIVLVTSLDAGGSGVRRGTAFCVSKDLFITNLHVVEGSTRITITLPDRRVFGARIESYDKDSDLALLKTNDNTSVRPLKLALGSPNVGDRIVVIGNPLGFTGTVTDGIVSAIRRLREEYIQITAPISPGSSGSPVFNLRGEVIGVATMRLKDGQNLNFAISSGYVNKIWPGRFLTENTPLIVPREQRSSRWRFLNDDKTLYDSQTIKRIGSKVEVWIEYLDRDGGSRKVLTEIECGERRIRGKQSVSYSSSGNVTSSSTYEEEWDAIVPSSNGESYFNILCKRQLDKQTSDALWEINEEAERFENNKNLKLAVAGYRKLIEKVVQLRKEGLDTGYIGLLTDTVTEDVVIRIYDELKDSVGLENFYVYLISTGKLRRYKQLAEFYKERDMLMKFNSVIREGIQGIRAKSRSKDSTFSDFINLADLLILQGSDIEAIAALKEGLRRFNNDEFLIEKLAGHLNRLKRFRETVDLITRSSTNTKFLQKNILSYLRDAYLALGDKYNANLIEADISRL